jgi:hypothetical protein
MPNGVTAGSRSDTSRPGLKQIFGCRFEKLRPCGAVQPRPKILRLEKHRHAVVNAAGGHDQRAAALTVVVLDVTTKASVATAGDFFDVIIDCTGDQAAMQRGFGFVGARRALRIWSAWFEQRYLFGPRIPQAQDSPVARDSRTTSRRCCVRCRLSVCQLGDCTLIPGRLRWPGTFPRLAAP